MEKLRGINISLAIFVVICFFLPWVQVGCVGIRDSVSGYTLARQGERLLLLIPILMFIVVIIGIGREWKRRTMLFAIASFVCGALTVYLMHRERAGIGNSTGLFTVNLTAWFWLGYFAAVGVALGGLAVLVGRSRSP